MRTSLSKYPEVSLVILKVNHRCNLACEYCYENIMRGDDLSIEKAIDFAEEVFSSTRRQKVTFVFHGGEPTLAEMGWYLVVVDGIRRLARAAEKVVAFGMQTNLVRVTDTQADLYAELGISLSASIDGAHGTAQQRQLAQKVASNFARLRQRGVKMGVLANINTSNWSHASAFVAWLETTLGVTKFKANLSHAVGAGINADVLTPDQAFRAQRVFIDHLLDSSGLGALEDNVTLEILRFLGLTPSGDGQNANQWLCLGRCCGAGSRVVSLSSSGAILPCGRFSWNEQKYKLSEVGTRGNAKTFKRVVDDFHAAHPENWANCSTCEARGVCSYGCQAFIVRSKAKLNIECLPTKLRYNYLVQKREALEAIAPVIAARYRNNGRAAPERAGQAIDA